MAAALPGNTSSSSSSSSCRAPRLGQARAPFLLTQFCLSPAAFQPGTLSLPLPAVPAPDLCPQLSWAPGGARAPAQGVGRLCCPWVTLTPFAWVRRKTEEEPAPGRPCGMENWAAEPFWGRKMLLACGKRHHSSKAWSTLKQVKRRAGRF